MRVTAASFGNDFRTQIAKLAERQMRVQRQIATGQRIDSPSDDPQAMRRVLDLRAELRVLNQYQDNIGKVRENSTVAYSSLNAMKKLNDRAGEIATMADASKPTEALQAYGKEINQLLEEAVRLANTKHRDVYIFSGTNSTTATYSTTRDANGDITGVTWGGNSNTSKVDIASDSTVDSNHPAEGAQGILKNSTNGADFIAHLITLRDNLNSGNTTNIKSNGIANVKSDETNFINHFSNLGAIQSRLDTSEAITRHQASSIDPLVSNEADVDMADAFVRLNEIQNAYTAALQSGGTLLQTSLLDYIR
jgi:flagellar hook-associated protein 3 FlgL